MGCTKSTFQRTLKSTAKNAVALKKRRQHEISATTFRALSKVAFARLALPLWSGYTMGCTRSTFQKTVKNIFNIVRAMYLFTSRTNV